MQQESKTTKKTNWELVITHITPIGALMASILAVCASIYQSSQMLKGVELQNITMLETAREQRASDLTTEYRIFVGKKLDEFTERFEKVHKFVLEREAKNNTGKSVLIIKDGVINRENAEEMDKLSAQYTEKIAELKSLEALFYIIDKSELVGCLQSYEDSYTRIGRHDVRAYSTIDWASLSVSRQSLYSKIAETYKTLEK